MNFDSRQGDRRLRRTIATVAAAILLVGQALAAGHFHPVSPRSQLAANPIGSVSDVCAVCLFHFHSPAVSATTPAPTAPAAALKLVSFAFVTGPQAAYNDHLFGRAPPASS